MDKQEAIDRLRIYRKEMLETGNTFFSDALKEAENDPDIARCLVDEAEFDAVFAEKLSSIQPPGDLKAKLLSRQPAYAMSESEMDEVISGVAASSELGATSPPNTDENDNIIPFPGPDFTPAATDQDPSPQERVQQFKYDHHRRMVKFRNIAFGLAAGLALFIGVSFYLQRAVPVEKNLAIRAPFLLEQAMPENPDAVDMGTFVNVLTAYSAEIRTLDYFSKDPRQLIEYLASANSMVPEDAPGGLKPLPGIGCQALNWSGKPIGLICFKGDRVYHLFTAQREDFPFTHDLPSYQPFYQQWENQSAVVWANETQLYILTSQGPAESDEVMTQLF